MSRSSIFSSETLDLRGAKPKALLLAVLVLLCLEFFLGRGDWIWRRQSQSSVNVIHALEDRVIAEASEPSIVCLGNSRLRDAVPPRELETHLGLPVGSVLNLAVTSGTPFDALTLYRRNRSRLSRARVLILDFEAHFVTRRPELTSRVRRFASLAERWKMFSDSDDLLRAVAGAIWRTYDARDPLRDLLWPSRGTWSTPLAFADDGRVEWRRSNQALVGVQLREDLQSKAERRFGKYEPNRLHIDMFLDLVREARADGLKVLLVHVPLRDEFVALSRDHYGSDYMYAWKRLQALAADVDASFAVESADHLGIADDAYFDYGHMKPEAATQFTTTLARQPILRALAR